MLKDRNISSHEYNMDKVNIILDKISTIYFEELKVFSKWLGEIDGNLVDDGAVLVFLDQLVSTNTVFHISSFRWLSSKTASPCP